MHPLAIVLSQDCDLDWDFEARQDGAAAKTMPNVLFAEMVTAEQLRGSPTINTEVWKRVSAKQGRPLPVPSASAGGR